MNLFIKQMAFQFKPTLWRGIAFILLFGFELTYAQTSIAITSTTQSLFTESQLGNGFSLPPTIKNQLGSGFRVDVTFNTTGMSAATPKTFLFGVGIKPSSSSFFPVFNVYIHNRQVIVERRIKTPSGFPLFTMPSWNTTMYEYDKRNVHLYFWIDDFAMKIYMFEGTTNMGNADIKRTCELQFYGMNSSIAKEYLTNTTLGEFSIVVPQNQPYFTRAEVTAAQDINRSPISMNAVQGGEGDVLNDRMCPNSLRPYFYPATFVNISDSGCGFKGTESNQVPFAKGVADLVKSWNPPFIVSNGDDNNGDSTPSGSRCGQNIDDNIGQFYADFIRPYDRSLLLNGEDVRYAGDINPAITEDRFFPIPGNHDYTSGINKWITYFRISWAANQYWYTFVKDGIRFFMLNTNTEEPNITNFSSTSPQALWLKTQLQISHNNPAELFQVVVMHHPPYTSVPKGNDHNKKLRWPFKDWGVDLVLSGDDHLYERNTPNSGVNQGLNFVTNGMGGSVQPKHVTQATQNAVTDFTIIKHYEACGTFSPDLDGDGCPPIYRQHGALKVVKDGDYLYCMFRNVNRELIDTFRVGRNPYVSSSLTDDAPTLLKINNTGDDISVYPNPTTGELTLHLQEQAESNATVRILDLAGKRVYTQPVVLSKGTQEISLGNLKTQGIAKGVYFLQVVSPQRKSTVKVVIQ